MYPITTAGRITGVVLMFSGLALFGVLAGTLASFFGFGSADDDETSDVTSDETTPAASAVDGTQAEDLETRLVELEQAIAAVRRQMHEAAPR